MFSWALFEFRQNMCRRHCTLQGPAARNGDAEALVGGDYLESPAARGEVKRSPYHAGWGAETRLALSLALHGALVVSLAEVEPAEAGEEAVTAVGRGAGRCHRCDPNLLSAMARRVSQVPPSQQSTQPAEQSFPPASPRHPPQPAPASPSVIVPVPRVPAAYNLDGDNLPHGPTAVFWL